MSSTRLVVPVYLSWESDVLFFTGSMSGLKLSVSRYAVTLVFKRLQNDGANYYLRTEAHCRRACLVSLIPTLIAPADY